MLCFNNNYKGKKNIIIYFSRADENYAVGYVNKGNTEIVAETIRDLLQENNEQVDIFKVDPLNEYAKDYDTCVLEVEERQRTHNAPIKEKIPNLIEYEVIYLGSPVYCGYMPEELVTALKDVDFTGKIIRPFTTHGGSEFGNVLSQIKSICKGASVVEGLAINGSLANSSKSKISEWL